MDQDTPLKSYYESTWAHERRVYIDEKVRVSFLQSALAALYSDRPLKILDTGCGMGRIAAACSKYGRVTGIDLTVAEARKRYPNLTFIEGDFLTTEINDSFDVVVSSEVIEHLVTEDHSKYIAKMAGILKDDGILLLTTPNKPVVQRYLRAGLIRSSNLQPVENWLNPTTLISLVSPSFLIEGISSAMIYPVSVKKIWLLNLFYSLTYNKLQMYRLVDPLLGKTLSGLYLTLIGRRKKNEETAT